MKVFLATFGSYGDVRPFLWMAGELMAAGHEVLLITNPTFQESAREAGVPFHPAGTVEDYRAAATPAARTGNAIRDQKERIEAARRLFTRLFLNPTEDTYRAIAGNLSGDDVVLGHFFAYGARLAAERHGLPFATICLAPRWLRSFEKPAGLSSRLRRMASAANTRFIDGQLFTAPMNGLRAELGLEPLQQSSIRWMFGGSNLCLFPRWFLDFPLEEGRDMQFAGFPPAARGSLPDAVEHFLVGHSRPVVFTAGTSITDGAAFFRAGLDALRTLGLPGILLTRAAGSIPDALPDTVLQADFAPLGSLLSRCAALVHHGGIGTASAALECGVPQLVCWRTGEQRENALVLAGLGAGRALPWSKLNGGAMARELALLTGGPALRPGPAAAAREGLTSPSGYLQDFMQKLRQN